ncbi:MAG TPA: DUF6279 family lipoprotein [Variovorax sp.]|nr:DUF6279 family lipoprotein [Variovorax sp.]
MPTFLQICCANLARIIGAALLAAALAGCSTLKLAYNNLPEFGYWWLDSYLDFDGSQTPRVRDELDRLLAWHRRNELPQWIAIVQKAQALAPQDVTPEQACELGEALRSRLLALTERAEPAAAELALSLSPAQLDQLQRKYTRLNAEYRSDWLSKSAEAQQTKRYERWLDRSEDFYGSLDTAQRRTLRRMVAESIFSASLFDAERKRRQGVVLATLRGLTAEPNMPASEAQRAVHAYVRSVAEPPAGRWREQQQALWQEGCRNFATLHNMTTTAQREQAVRRLHSYEVELRELSAQ